MHTKHIPVYVIWEQNVHLRSESSTLPRNLENFGPQRAVLLLTSEGWVVSVRTTNFNTYEHNTFSIQGTHAVRPI